jgi:hypothetical protein
MARNIFYWQKTGKMWLAWIFVGFSSEKSGIFFGKNRDDFSEKR